MILEDTFYHFLDLDFNFPKEREGGQQMEVAIGEFFNNNGAEKEKVCSLLDWYDCPDFDFFFIEGVEFRPKI